MAEAIDVDDSYISKLENGHVPPPPNHMLLAMAKPLKVDEGQLLQSAGRIPTDFAAALSASPIALQFMREALEAQLDYDGWREILSVLRDMVRASVLIREFV